MLAFNHLGKLGRLGNQMFQYASLRGIAATRGYEFGIPPVDYKNEWEDHQLLEVFELPHLNRNNIKLLDMGHAPVAQENSFSYQPILHEMCPNDVSLWGFFQSPKYFDHIASSIREDFTFREHILKPCKENFNFENAISLHVRRTDYLTNSANHYNLGLDYYKDALVWYDDPENEKRPVIVFSDDPEWCKQQEVFSSDRFVVSESGDNAIDLCLMSMCTSHIIANSSFSWWGAWLADSKDVYYPAQWFGPAIGREKNQMDIVCEHWKMIGEMLDLEGKDIDG